ncbi:MAG: nicotinamide riboside transporter PnuC [Porticoccaceae bacterium]
MFPWLNLELLAVVLSLAYLLLAMRENSLCWYCAFFGTAIYIWIFGGVKLYMESLLNLYYLGMAVYGWYQWQKGGQDHHGLAINSWSPNQHLAAFLGVAIATLISGFLLAQNTDARLPYVDSFTTWGSVLTTYMVARKVLENWLYWIVIDSVSIYLYLDRELYYTAALFAIYVVLVVIGFFSWKKLYREQRRQDFAADLV